MRLGYVKPEVLNWSPRIILLHNFLSVEECDYLRAIALPRLQVSTVVDAKTGKGIRSDVRTSSGMFLSAEERKYPMIQESINSELPACLMKKVFFTSEGKGWGLRTLEELPKGEVDGLMVTLGPLCGEAQLQDISPGDPMVSEPRVIEMVEGNSDEMMVPETQIPKPMILILAETRIENGSRLSVLRNLGYDSIRIVPSVGRSGGIAMAWDSTLLSLTIIEENRQLIHMQCSRANLPTFLLTAIYAVPHSNL
ncbi:hypothetical protein K1719_045432 [Acacia pycnantha]|nr:hypothetical protein K1719_045432 [Acacia pycnantha]